ncbi:DUF423 domain-containing protein [Methylocapsa polymorpha]|uniref:DUF423 domain-containing protein n=1 Tax=Methylocapsa polymorpha TaxID=3080828 RepID=A0ABZ0HVG2_9HYPH|nr:DUF423 domain-containing protein [Methylocapsa sp. RX1]
MRRLAFIAAALGGLAGGAGVVLSALAAHGPAHGPLIDTSANFLILHAAATIAVAALALAAPQRGVWLLVPAALFILGGALFCGDLATRAFTGARLFPMAAPIGGALLIFGWALVAVASLAAAWTRQNKS